jgi:hypothetical protein
LQNSQILYTFVLRAEIVTIFGRNVVGISARNTKVYKICELCKAIFSAFYNILQPNFAILLMLVCSFREYTFFFQDKNLVYNGNCLLFLLELRNFEQFLEISSKRSLVINTSRTELLSLRNRTRKQVLVLPCSSSYPLVLIR